MSPSSSSSSSSLEFCETALWDSNLTWYTDTPQFTRCFQSTVLVYTPVGILLLLLPWEILRYKTSKARDVPWGPRIVARVVLNLMIICLSVFQLLMYITDDDAVFDQAEKVGRAVSMFGFLLSFCLIFLARRFGQITSPVQFFYWLSYCICKTFSFTSTVLSKEEEGGIDSHEIVHSLILAVGICNLILTFFADDPPIYSDLTKLTDNPSPKENCSFIALILHSWFDPFVYAGWKKPLVQNDLWDLSYENSYKGLVPKWERYLYAAGTENVSALKPLIKNFGSFFSIGFACQLMYIGLIFVNPQLLDLLIQFVEEKQEVWKGYLYVVLLGIVSFLIGLSDSWYWNNMRILSMRVFTVLSASVYKKSLHLSACGRQEYTSGEVVNLIAVDCSKVQESCMFVTFMFTTPIHILLTGYFLWAYLGYSVLIGIGVLFLMLPLNGICWNIMEKYQQKQMEQKDLRVNLVNEILNGIKVLKLYAWEASFSEEISNIRNKEVTFLKYFQYLEGTQFLMWNCAPFIVAISAFASYILIDPINNVLDAKTAFVSLTLFNTLKEPLFMLPFGIVNIIQGGVSIGRINKFLNADEVDPSSVTHDSKEDPITVDNASLTWGTKSDKEILKNLSFRVKPGSLVGIVGQVGAGKSSILSALLGEMTKTKGSINTCGEIAYVSQQAWMRNMTLKNNILFGKELSNRLYSKVIENCALTDDLAMLPHNDQTEIGEKGINLSGGQKQRINLARAVYSNRDIYLLDDPLSAVDAHVGKHLFENVIGPKGMLNKKTRILVTHGIGFLPEMDLILVVKDGRIAEMGKYESLINQKGEFSDFILDQLQQNEDFDVGTDTEQLWKDLESSQGKEESIKKNIKSSARRRRPKTHSLGSISQVSSDDENPRSTFTDILVADNKSSDETVYKKLPAKDLIDEEYVEIKSVKIDIYRYYIKSAGISLFILSIVAYFFFQICTVGANIWLSVWSSDEDATDVIAVRNKYLIGYGIIGLLQSVFIFAAIILLTFATINASILLHNQMLQRILKSPMSFFDTTPTGRIVNRFSKDIDEVDIMLPMHFKDVLNQIFNVLGVVFVLSFVSPAILIAVVPLAGFFFLVQNFYLRTSRQLKRLISINRSPINSHLDDTLSGAATIRAFGFQDQFEDENESKLEELMKSQYPENISNSWLFLRLQVIGNLLIILTSLITVITRDTIDPGLVGLSLSYALTCQLDIYMVVRFCADLEKSIVSVERIKEYQETPQEAPSTTYQDPDESWPDSGNVSFENFSTRYRPGLDLVLSNINCNILGGEKIGIVGRTGAGKSSITLSLFRIIEAASGRIRIDNVDIAQIGLTRLRSGLTIIPQDPVIFSGTLRSNLDPFNQHSDREIWRALEMANLSQTARQMGGGLQHMISEGGINLSVGQRQLLCLVRALLRKTKILVLDEATAAVDLETDDLIQKTIRREFSHCTVLTIAHRLRTVLDSNRVMVMDRGQVIEFDHPTTLLKNRTTVFYSMAKDAGIVN